MRIAEKKLQIGHICESHIIDKIVTVESINSMTHKKTGLIYENYFSGRKYLASYLLEVRP